MNIKSLADRINRLSAKAGSLSWHEVDELTRLQGQAHVLADVLLRVMEDGEKLYVALELVQGMMDKRSRNVDKILESHNELLEELNNEIQS